MLHVKGMMCQNCVKHVKEALEKVEGVTAADVRLEPGTAAVTLSAGVADSVLSQAVVDEGYEVLSVEVA
ncbi:MAG: cation transporter [Fretibacterium sp.]|nr:cation transporter [Fretibacterium sp.]